jgi:hypothetical protein
MVTANTFHLVVPIGYDSSNFCESEFSGNLLQLWLIIIALDVACQNQTSSLRLFRAAVFYFGMKQKQICLSICAKRPALPL